jgi:rhodanese-related sulfurtransferase
MIQLLRKLFGIGPQADMRELVRNGAQIIDVRTPAEFQRGHIDGSVNIPLQQLSANLSRIKKEKPVITCCASGMRSASARAILKSNGFQEVYNGGGWMALGRKIE